MVRDRTATARHRSLLRSIWTPPSDDSGKGICHHVEYQELYLRLASSVIKCHQRPIGQRPFDTTLDRLMMHANPPSDGKKRRVFAIGQKHLRTLHPALCETVAGACQIDGKKRPAAGPKPSAGWSRSRCSRKRNSALWRTVTGERKTGSRPGSRSRPRWMH
jgi:hypothetical protein